MAKAPKAPKAEGGASRIPLMVRTSPAFRAQLEEAAAASGRSLAQEAELRLERSFELVSMIETMAKSSGDMAGKIIEDQCRRIEQHMVELGGGANLFMAWSMLSQIVRSVEAETGKSIREDEFTRNKAEREVLGYIPGIFRKLPPTYGEFKNEAATYSAPGLPESGLAALAKIPGALPPLGHKGPWPPEQD
jgi:hypothetical protein